MSVTISGSKFVKSPSFDSTVLLSLQQSAFGCLCHVLDDETSASSAILGRIASNLDHFFTLLASSVDTVHCRSVHNVIAEFVRLLSRLIATDDVDFTVKVLSHDRFYLKIKNSIFLYFFTQFISIIDKTFKTIIMTDLVFNNLLLGSRAFHISAPTTCWNSLPQNVHDCSSLASFRNHLKTHYFSSAFCALWHLTHMRLNSNLTTALYKSFTYLLA